jgi:hypothetical protein
MGNYLQLPAEGHNSRVDQDTVLEPILLYRRELWISGATDLWVSRDIPHLSLWEQQHRIRRYYKQVETAESMMVSVDGIVQDSNAELQNAMVR